MDSKADFSSLIEEEGSPLQLRLAELEQGEEDCAHDRRLRHPRALQTASSFSRAARSLALSARVEQCQSSG